MKNSDPSVAIVIVNYNNYLDTIECLESLKSIDYKNYSVFLVDNGSQNESVKYLSKYITTFPKEVFLLTTEKNLGFAGGCNLAIKKALELKYDYILLLNNDTIVEKDFLSKMISLSESRSDIGIVGCKIRYYNDKQKIWYAGGYISWFRFSGVHIGINEIDRGQYDKMKDVTFITGCCMLIKNEVLSRVGLLCEDFFLYNEDLDYCVRVMDHGYRLVYCPDSIVYHKVGQASGGEKSPFSIKCFVKSKKIFFKKNRRRVSFVRYYISYSLWFVFTFVKGVFAFFTGKVMVGRAYMEGLFLG